MKTSLSKQKNIAVTAVKRHYFIAFMKSRWYNQVSRAREKVVEWYIKKISGSLSSPKIGSKRPRTSPVKQAIKSASGGAGCGFARGRNQDDQL